MASSVVKTTTFAEQRAFAAKVAKEKAAIEWAVQQSTEEQQEQQQQRRRVRQRRTTRDGQDIFAVTFFDGDKPKRTDWLAEDARRNAEFGVKQPAKGSLGYRLRQLKSKGLSKSRSEPCLSTKKRERKNREEDSADVSPFRTLFPLPAKGIDMRKETARDQADLFKPRPETVALSATEKHEMRMWGTDVDAVTWPDGTKPPPWVKAVGNTTNKWANKELGIRAAREEQEFVEKLRETSPSRNKQPSVAHPARPPGSSSPFSSSPSAKPAALPPWVKELPPVRDGRRQFAAGETIPFLDQHVYPEGGVAEARRARRREKEAFLKTVVTSNSSAAAQRAAQRKYARDASAGTAGASKRRPPRVHRASKEPGFDGDGAGEGAVGREIPRGRAWPYGPVCMVAPTQGKEPSSRRGSGESGGGSLAGEIKCSDADGAGAGDGGDAGDAGYAGDGGAGDSCAAVEDDAQQASLKDGDVAPGSGAADVGTEAADARNRSPVNKKETAAYVKDIEHPAEGAAGKRSSDCAEKQGDTHPDGCQQPQPEVPGQGNESGSTANEQERASRAATPSPVVTSSIRVLDMGMVRPPE